MLIIAEPGEVFIELEKRICAFLILLHSLIEWLRRMNIEHILILAGRLLNLARIKRLEL
jgi:hypothetical protein